MNDCIAALNAETKEERLAALRQIVQSVKNGEIPEPEKTGYVNNHIHTCYSFSPYSPTAALYHAWQSGLGTAGIMDHDSVSGAEEFIEAGDIVGMPVTVGVECRVKVKGTFLEGRRINNPDQNSVTYVAMHGIPHQHIERVHKYFEPQREKRNRRNRVMCEKISRMTAPFCITLDFDQDVLPLSKYKEGGSVTERHLLFALAKKITALYPTPTEVIDFLEKSFKIPLSDKLRARLLEGTEHPEFYEYDILGILKSSLVEKFYVPADDECLHISEFVWLAREFGAISAYAYLGDVGDSVTGDKAAQQFEDSYLDELMATVHRLGFNAVTYMPSRNTQEQLRRVMDYCHRYGLFEISGEDINSPRQKFICEALDQPMFEHLKDATYALIGHERLATQDITHAMFSPEITEKYPNIYDRIDLFAEAGKSLI